MCRLIFLRDPSHREWNDCRSALKQSGFWATILETTLTFNLPYGPWDSASWFKAAQEAARLYVAITRQRPDPLLELLQPRIAADRGHFEILPSALSGQLNEDTFRCKGPKVSLTRWFGWMDSARYNLARWHSTLAVLLFIGVSLGTFQDANDFPTLGGTLPSALELQQVISVEACDGADGAQAQEEQQAPRAAEQEGEGDDQQTEEPTAVDSVRALRARCSGLGRIRSWQVGSIRHMIPSKRHVQVAGRLGTHGAAHWTEVGTLCTPQPLSCRQRRDTRRQRWQKQLPESHGWSTACY